MLQMVPICIRWLIALAFMAMIVALSLTPAASRSGETVFHWLVDNTSTPAQKILHVVIYAVLAFLLVWALDNVATRIGRVALAVTLVVGLGATLEWCQLNVPGRFGSLTDVALNAVGALLGIILAWLII